MKKVKAGILWSTLERFSVQGAQFLINILLARLLMPADYGLVAMATVFISLGQVLIDSGFSNALIQKRNKSENDYTTVFVFSFLTSVLIYLVLYAFSPAIARFYHSIELIALLRVIGLIMPLSSLFVVQRAILTIKMDFRAQAVVSLVSVIVAGSVAIYLAYYKQVGVWALVYQTLLSNVLTAVLMWFITGWYPKGSFSKKSFSELFGFGSKLLMTGVLHTVYSNLYSLIIGKKFSSSDLGYYNRGFSFSYITSETITNIIYRVAYPIQCELQDDSEKLYSVFNLNLRGGFLFLLPFIVCLMSFAEPMVLTLLGAKWLASVKFIVVLSFAHLFRPLISVNETVLTAKGRTDLFLKLEVYSKVFAIIILVFTVSFGVYVMCLGIVLSTIFNYILSVYFAQRVINTSLYNQIKQVFPLILVGVFLGLLCYLCGALFHSNSIRLFLGTLICFVAYGLVLYLFRFKELKLLSSKIS